MVSSLYQSSCVVTLRNISCDLKNVSAKSYSVVWAWAVVLARFLISKTSDHFLGYFG